MIATPCGRHNPVAPQTCRPANLPELVPASRYPSRPIGYSTTSVPGKAQTGPWKSPVTSYPSGGVEVYE